MNIHQEQYIYLGFDFGLRRIGVAIGQTVTKTASPLPIILAKQGIPNWQEIKKLIDSWKPTALIVGMPLQMDNSEFELVTQKAREFAEELHKHFHLPVYVIDESLTTKAAREYIYDTFGYRALQTQPVDSFAAKIILESWMNLNNDHTTPTR
jgi:putative holliday junction resolvase